MDFDRVRRCPRCDQALIDGPDGPRCLYCGYDFSVSPEDIEAGQYFNASETAVLGLLAGLEIGVALGVVADDSSTSLIPVYALFGATVGGLVGGWLGSRLARRWRSKFRLLLLSACAGGLVVLVTALAGWDSTDGLLGGSVALTGLIYLISQRAAAQRADRGEVGESRE